jgi:hypothetical protein
VKWVGKERLREVLELTVRRAKDFSAKEISSQMEPSTSFYMQIKYLNNFTNIDVKTVLYQISQRELKNV